MLLRAGAKVDARDEDGWTALIFAAWKTSTPAVVSVLLHAGANAKDSRGKSVISYAKENKKLYKTKYYWALNEATFK